MSASAARKLDDTDDDGTEAPAKKRRHLRLVTDEFINRTAAASGAPTDSVLEALSLITLARSEGGLLQPGWAVEIPDYFTTPAAYDMQTLEHTVGHYQVDAGEVLRVVEYLARDFQAVSEQLRAQQGTLIPSTEVRKNWSETLDRVRDGEILYVTHHGERVAALVPPDVADFYRDAEDKADAEAIDQAAAAREAGEEPMAYEDFAAGLGL